MKILAKLILFCFLEIAQTLFSQENSKKTIDFESLSDDEKPRLVNWKSDPDDISVPIIKTGLNLKTDNGIYPYLLMKIIIDQNGDIHNLNVTDVMYAYNENKKYIKQLIEIAKETIRKDFKNWIPGYSNGQRIKVLKKFKITFE